MTGSVQSQSTCSSFVRCIQVVCFGLALVMGCGQAEAAEAVDAHPSARRDKYDDNYGMMATFQVLAAPSWPQPQQEDG